MNQRAPIGFIIRHSSFVISNTISPATHTYSTVLHQFPDMAMRQSIFKVRP